MLPVILPLLWVPGDGCYQPSQLVIGLIPSQPQCWVHFCCGLIMGGVHNREADSSRLVHPVFWSILYNSSVFWQFSQRFSSYISTPLVKAVQTSNAECGCIIVIVAQIFLNMSWGLFKFHIFLSRRKIYKLKSLHWHGNSRDLIYFFKNLPRMSWTIPEACFVGLHFAVATYQYGCHPNPNPQFLIDLLFIISCHERQWFFFFSICIYVFRVVLLMALKN